jgi:hypothetical protein
MFQLFPIATCQPNVTKMVSHDRNRLKASRCSIEQKKRRLSICDRSIIDFESIVDGWSAIKRKVKWFEFELIKRVAAELYQEGATRVERC